MDSYIHKIFVHHNYVKKHFEIDLSTDEKKAYRNLIITGKNGTGKSTLLRTLNKELFQFKTGILPVNVYYDLISKLKKNETKEELDKLSFVNPKVELVFGQISNFIEEDLLVIYIPTFRNIPFDNPNRSQKLSLKQALTNQSKHTQQLKQSNLKIANFQRDILNLEKTIKDRNNKAKSIEKELKNLNKDQSEDFSTTTISNNIKNIRTEIANYSKQLEQKRNQLNQSIKIDFAINPYISLSKFFLQYLVNMKEKQAYAIADEETENIILYNDFFDRLEELFKYLYEDATLRLRHSFKKNKFYFQFGDKRTANFTQLADGFKSILIIIAEILLQKQAFIEEKNLDFEPSGIVLLDEIEAHLHLSLQEKVFPAISNFFPKLQFILATHSPQVCASDKNSFVYDLSRNHLEKNYLGGISYDVLSKAHFGLESEYSIDTTQLLNQAKKLLSKPKKTDKDIVDIIELEKKLTEISPELAYELVLFLKKMK